MSLANSRSVFKLPQKEWWILISLDGQWGYEQENRFIAFTSPLTCIPLLPLLELSYPEAVASIQQGLNQAGVNLNLLSTFPFNHTLQLALNWNTEYWPSLAVKWLENGYPISEEFVNRSEERRVGKECRSRW